MSILTACPHCNTGNRVGEGETRAAKCGRCGAKLFNGAPIDVDDAAFDAQIKFSTMPVLVDVWAPWCAPCRMMAPTFAEIAAALEPQVRFLKLNADNNQAPAKLGVRGIPALILFHEGREIARQAGLMSTDQLRAWLERALVSINRLEPQS